MLSEEEHEGLSMDIWGHIGELRTRLLKALIALILTTMVSFAITQYFIRLLAVPVGGLGNLQSIDVTENIGVFMRVALLSGFILAMPVIVYQLIAFVMPGLENNEKRWLLLAIPAATFLFLCGVAFAYFIMLPSAIPFLTTFLGVKTTPRLSNYIGFVTNLLFWIGVSFEMPLLVFVLAKLRFVSAGMLARQWRVAIIVIAVIAAFVTPTVDPVNMGLMMLPLMVLYVLSIIMAKIARPRD
jgi:sec-independent protein translocase protein TatC